MFYGFLVFVVSADLTLPLGAAVFNSGDPIKNMAEMAGWGTFIVEHLLYGLVLGLLAAVAPSKPAVVPTDPSHVGGWGGHPPGHPTRLLLHQ